MPERLPAQIVATKIALSLLVRQLHRAKLMDANVFARSVELTAQEAIAGLKAGEAEAARTMMLIAEALVELAHLCREDEPGPEQAEDQSS